MTHFHEIYSHYSRPFYRKWRARKFAARQSALDKIARYILGIGPKPTVPLVNDEARSLQVKHERRKYRQLNQDMPERLPVAAYGGGKWKGVRGNPPVPNKAVADALAKYTLVVIVPEYNTSKKCTVDGCR